MSPFDFMARCGRATAGASDELILRKLQEIGSNAVALDWGFCEAWVIRGAQVYDLQHSIAALLAATRSPELNLARLPHEAFAIKIPAAFLPVEGNTSSDVILCVQQHEQEAQVGIWDPVRQGSRWILTGALTITEDNEVTSARREWLLAIRMVSNVVAYVTEHRECVERVTKPGGERTVHSVRPPRDIVIDRAFRDRVSALVSAGTQSEVRTALAHMVRGHWRNQPVGEGRAERRLTWVRPHRRGDESLGVVVKRTERIS